MSLKDYKEVYYAGRENERDDIAAERELERLGFRQWPGFCRKCSRCGKAVWTEIKVEQNDCPDWTECGRGI